MGDEEKQLNICPDCYDGDCYDCWGGCDCPLDHKEVRPKAYNPMRKARKVDDVKDPKGRI